MTKSGTKNPDCHKSPPQSGKTNQQSLQIKWLQSPSGTYTPDAPIYVGKAVPPGSRRGDDVDIDRPVLRQRLREHTRSIAAAENLDLSHFTCRHLSVVPVWITLAERFLVNHHRPLWNVCLDGFGDHDPGKGRSGSERSWWDTLHPGRLWTEKLQKNKSEAAALEIVRNFLDVGG